MIHFYMHYIYGNHTVEAAINNKNRVIYELVCLPQHEQHYRSLLYSTNRSKTCKLRIVKSFHQLGIAGLQDTVHQGVCAFIKLIPISEISTDHINRILILDQIKDIRNIGAIIRSAAAMNVTQIIYTKSHTLDIYDPKHYSLLAKSASGACEHVNLIGVTNLSRCIEDLKKRDFWIIGLDESGQDIESFVDMPKIAMIVGCEGDGLRRLTLEKCDLCCKINTNPTFPCLNASVAASLAMYVLRK